MLGVAPLIAARVALSKERERTAGTHLVRLAFVAPQGGRASPVLIRFEPAEGPEEAPWPVSLEDEALTLVVLDLELQVEPQAPRRPSVEPERL